MTHLQTAILPALALLWPTTLPAQSPAWDFSKTRVIELSEGPTKVAILGPAASGLVMRAYRGNYNAHSFHYVTIYVTHPDSESGAPRWEVVPIRVRQQFELGITTSQGADCVLRDLRLVQRLPPDPPALVLILAEREFGSSFADKRAVTFTRYELAQNDSGEPGTPGLFFAQTAKRTSSRSYCDVEEAFTKELGLGRGAP